MHFLSNLHTHTVFSDGANTCGEYVLAAIRKGFVSIGFSDHAPTAFDTSYCMKPEARGEYLAEIGRLRREYADRIEIYAGLESDACEPAVREGLDYVIGSVHYLPDAKTGEYHTIDYLPEQFERAQQSLGGIKEMVALYYDMVAETAERYRPEILGHMDLICKLNASNRYFDPRDRWYRELALAAAERIAKTGVIVELNTGAISRGYTDVPYPAPFLLERLCARNVPVTLSSDCHSAQMLDCAFEQAISLLRQCGYRRVKQTRGGRFEDLPID